MICLKKNFTEISIALRRHKSTISRKVNNLSGIQYKAMEAHNKAFLIMVNKRYGRSKILGNPNLLDYIHRHLAKRWPPDQISVSLKRTFPMDKTMQASHETISLYIYLHSKKELKKMLIVNCAKSGNSVGMYGAALIKEQPLKILPIMFHPFKVFLL